MLHCTATHGLLSCRTPLSALVISCQATHTPLAPALVRSDAPVAFRAIGVACPPTKYMDEQRGWLICLFAPFGISCRAEAPPCCDHSRVGVVGAAPWSCCPPTTPAAAAVPRPRSLPRSRRPRRLRCLAPSPCRVTGPTSQTLQSGLASRDALGSGGRRAAVHGRRRSEGICRSQRQQRYQRY